MSVQGKNVIFVLGGPGSGKGTQAIAISKKYGFGYASAGDLLREEASKPDSVNGQRIKEIISAGQLVPPELLVETLKHAIVSSPSQYFLLDGFPRSLVQDEKFREQAGLADCVLLLDVPTEVLIDRLRKRGLTSGRADDNDTVIPKRVETHNRDTLPVIEKWEKEGKLEKVDGNKSIQEVEELFVNTLRKYWRF
ncbi:Adenylate kinase family protein [Tritrichomonas foetus]|uniref:Adenylate kinase family protein n=1 Tax=Tritrichomonas foetus TaxID=1144522 RepID=A0A1J4JUH4_9EUKA|nr:Adenylate kinase family protein [Tritrichomonas foetus]|eukprot:OHT02651.1 Adenylate kinase family protein [Tritrichomonas foetus]